MGTRGHLAFITLDQRQLRGGAYNHWDSYPDGLDIINLS